MQILMQHGILTNVCGANVMNQGLHQLKYSVLYFYHIIISRNFIKNHERFHNDKNKLEKLRYIRYDVIIFNS